MIVPDSYFPEAEVFIVVCVLTLQRNTVHGESSGQLGGNLHAATNQGLSKHMLEGLVKVGAVAQLADHGNGVLSSQTQDTGTVTSLNKNCLQ